MAESLHPSSPPHPATSKPLADDSRKPPNKRKPTTTTETHPLKRPHHSGSSFNSDEIKDTASSKPDQEEDIEEVPISDDKLFQELNDYEFRNGVNPVVNDYHMQRFLFPYLHMGVGNEGGWESKIRHLKFKFRNHQTDLIDPAKMEEFSLWKKMFDREPPPDEGSSIS